MAISLLHDVQARGLAAALANIKRDEMDHTLSISPPMSANNSASALYPGLQQAANAFSMLSPQQLMVANQQAAAAFMAAQIPTMSLATLLPHHHPLFGSWPNTAPHMPLASGPHSPPASPHSPAVPTTPSNSAKHNHSLISPTANSQSELPLKKPRKLNVKKDVHSTSMEISLNVSDIYNPAGPISPPSSGSSPNSTLESHNNAVVAAATAAVTTSAAHSKDPSRDKSFTCKICSRSFGYKHVLQNHERTHTGEKPFECPECHKRFTRDHHLKTHMRLHTGEKPYHCSHCDRQFVQVANLRRHLRVHTGERPYTCEICDGKFSDSNQLKSHMLVHNGEKPFECERCHMKFRRRHHLLNHKCGSAGVPGSSFHSPPTSPCDTISVGDYALCDQKSVIGSNYGSEESMDVGRPSTISTSAYELLEHHNSVHHAHHQHHALSATLAVSENIHSTVHTEDEDEEDAPLDLSESDMFNADASSSTGRKRHDIRRVFRLPAQIMHVHSEMPEQTEPEDLSVHRNNSHSENFKNHSTDSMLMMHNDIEMEELDDAAALFMRQQQQLIAMKNSMKME